MPDCKFTMTPASIPAIAKKGEQVRFTANPPGMGTCDMLCTTSGDIHVSQCGGGSAVVTADSDNATGTLFVTMTCKRNLPEEGIIACGPTTVAVPIGASPPSWTIKQKVKIVYTVISMGLGIAGLVIGAILGGIPGTLIGWFGGIGIGIGIAVVIERILDP